MQQPLHNTRLLFHRQGACQFVHTTSSCFSARQSVSLRAASACSARTTSNALSQALARATWHAVLATQCTCQCTLARSAAAAAGSVEHTAALVSAAATAQRWASLAHMDGRSRSSTGSNLSAAAAPLQSVQQRLSSVSRSSARRQASALGEQHQVAVEQYFRAAESGTATCSIQPRAACQGHCRYVLKARDPCCCLFCRLDAATSWMQLRCFVL